MTTIIDSYKGFPQRLEWSGGRQEDGIRTVPSDITLWEFFFFPFSENIFFCNIR